MAVGSLGYTGLLRAGEDPFAAWQRSQRECEAPDVRHLLAVLAETEDGRAVLAYARRRWAAYGLPPPWDPAAAADAGRAGGGPPGRR